MNGNSSNEIGASSPSIPGPYQSPEQTEAFPLKQSLYHGGDVRTRTKGLQILSNCCSGPDKTNAGLRVIIMCFAVLTTAVIVAQAIQIYSGDYQLVPHGSVATDHPRCSTVGTDILKKGGNAVDAAIAATFCMGVVNPHVTGLGSGGFMIIYSHRKQEVMDIIDFRETAPSAVNVSSSLPGSLVGIPGLPRGLALAHQLYGKLPWKQLVMPSVQTASAGFVVLDSLVQSVQSHLLSKSGDLYDLLSKLQPGRFYKSPNLADTLELIANEGVDVFYNGSIAKSIIEIVNNFGGSMTAQDLATYKAARQPFLDEIFAGFRVIVPGVPSGGEALLEMLKKFHDLNATETGKDFTSHVVIDTVEAAENIYKSLLQGGPTVNMKLTDRDVYDTINFTNAAASHVSAVDLNDIYVSVVSGLNTWLGSEIFVNKSFILNNALINFGVEKSKPIPGERPVSLSTPVIAVEKRRICGRRLVFGSGDPTVALQLLINMLVLNKDINWSIEAPRFHIENENRTIYLEGLQEQHLSNGIVQELSLSYHLKNLTKPYLSSNIVEKYGDVLASHSDSRGGGVASRF